MKTDSLLRTPEALLRQALSLFAEKPARSERTVPGGDEQHRLRIKDLVRIPEVMCREHAGSIVPAWEPVREIQSTAYVSVKAVPRLVIERAYFAQDPRQPAADRLDIYRFEGRALRAYAFSSFAEITPLPGEALPRFEGFSAQRCERRMVVEPDLLEFLSGRLPQGFRIPYQGVAFERHCVQEGAHAVPALQGEETVLEGRIHAPRASAWMLYARQQPGGQEFLMLEQISAPGERTVLQVSFGREITVTGHAH